MPRSRSARARTGTSFASTPRSSRSPPRSRASAESRPSPRSRTRWRTSSRFRREEELAQLRRAQILRPPREPRRVEGGLREGEKERRHLAAADGKEAALLRFLEDEIALFRRHRALVEDQLQRLRRRVYPRAQPGETLREQILAPHELLTREPLAGRDRYERNRGAEIAGPELLVMRQSRQGEPGGVSDRVRGVGVDAREALRREQRAEALEKLALVQRHRGALVCQCERMGKRGRGRAGGTCGRAATSGGPSDPTMPPTRS